MLLSGKMVKSHTETENLNMNNEVLNNSWTVLAEFLEGGILLDSIRSPGPIFSKAVSFFKPKIKIVFL